MKKALKALYFQFRGLFLFFLNYLLVLRLDQFTITLYRAWRSVVLVLKPEDRHQETPKSIYRWVSIQHWCESSPGNGKYYPLIPAESIAVVAPKFIGLPQSSATANCPEIYYALLERVTVFGGTNVIICSRDTLILDEVGLDRFDRLKFQFPEIPLINQNHIMFAAYNHRREIPCAISLVGRGSNNLYHWLYEFIPKLKLLEFVQQNVKDWPVLVDEAVRNIPQLLEIVKRCAPERELIFVGKAEQVKVGQLIHLSRLVWFPFDLKAREELQIEDFVYNSLAIDYLREKLNTSAIQTERRVFLSRNRFSERRRTNEAEVFSLLERLGFELVCPEEYSFEEQAFLFAEAKFLVGASGAAFSNIIFCKPGTVVICLVSAKVNIGIFSNFAKDLGVQLIYLPGEGGTLFGKLHRPFNVDLGQLELAMNSVLGDSTAVCPAVDGGITR